MPNAPLDPARLQPWTRAVWDALADGQWHSLEDVVWDAILTVPPGRAFRKAARGRDVDDKTAFRARGQRMIAQEGVRSLLRTGRIERRHEPGRQLRRTPAA